MSAKTLQSLDLAIAQKQVRDLSDSLARVSDENEACNRLQEASEAYRWMSRAEESIRQGVYCGLIEFTPQLDEAIELLYREWLASCEATEKLLARHVERGGKPVDARELAELSSAVREKINSMAWVRKSRKFRNEPAYETSES